MPCIEYHCYEPHNKALVNLNIKSDETIVHMGIIAVSESIFTECGSQTTSISLTPCSKFHFVRKDIIQNQIKLYIYIYICFKLNRLSLIFVLFDYKNAFFIS